MRLRTDDEVYRVNAVWLGPPKATFPWQVRYVAWGIGTVVFIAALAIERSMNIGFGFFSTAWALIITIVITRWLAAKITHERPLGAVIGMARHELATPRKQTRRAGATAELSRVRVQADRPRPRTSRIPPKKGGRS